MCHLNRRRYLSYDPEEGDGKERGTGEKELAFVCLPIRRFCKSHFDSRQDRHRGTQFQSRNSNPDGGGTFDGRIMVFAKGKQKEIGRIDRKELGFICLSGLATGGSWLCYYKALQDGLASVVVPIDKLSILVTIAFSYLVFHEKLTKRAALGLVLIVAGTLLMIL